MIVLKLQQSSAHLHRGGASEIYVFTHHSSKGSEQIFRTGEHEENDGSPARSTWRRPRLGPMQRDQPFTAVSQAVKTSLMSLFVHRQPQKPLCASVA